MFSALGLSNTPMTQKMFLFIPLIFALYKDEKQWNIPHNVSLMLILISKHNNIKGRQTIFFIITIVANILFTQTIMDLDKQLNTKTRTADNSGVMTAAFVKHVVKVQALLYILAYHNSKKTVCNLF